MGKNRRVCLTLSGAHSGWDWHKCPLSRACRYHKVALACRTTRAIVTTNFQLLFKKMYLQAYLHQLIKGTLRDKSEENISTPPPPFPSVLWPKSQLQLWLSGFLSRVSSTPCMLFGQSLKNLDLLPLPVICEQYSKSSGEHYFGESLSGYKSTL